MPTTATSTGGAFGCPAALPAPCSCWLGLLGLGAAPAAYAGALLVYQRRARNRRRLRRRRRHGPGLLDGSKEEGEEHTAAAVSTDRMLDKSSTSITTTTTTTANGNGNGGSSTGSSSSRTGGSNGRGPHALPPADDDDHDAGAVQPPRRWPGVVKHGAWPGLFWREALAVLHIGYQLYMLLPLLGELVAPSKGGGAGDFWWQHNLVRGSVLDWLMCHIGVLQNMSG